MDRLLCRLELHLGSPVVPINITFSALPTPESAFQVPQAEMSSAPLNTQVKELRTMVEI
jgi:hypothetical protein